MVGERWSGCFRDVDDVGAVVLMERGACGVGNNRKWVGMGFHMHVITLVSLPRYHENLLLVQRKVVMVSHDHTRKPDIIRKVTTNLTKKQVPKEPEMSIVLI